MKPPVTTTVQPKADTHPRAGQSGSVTAYGTDLRPLAMADDEVGVKWDLPEDNPITIEKIADLNVRQA